MEELKKKQQKTNSTAMPRTLHEKVHSHPAWKKQSSQMHTDEKNEALRFYPYSPAMSSPVSLAPFSPPFSPPSTQSNSIHNTTRSENIYNEGDASFHVL